MAVSWSGHLAQLFNRQTVEGEEGEMLQKQSHFLRLEHRSLPCVQKKQQGLRASTGL
jgi:hypothetical protein